jgi:hypothetical protein
MPLHQHQWVFAGEVVIPTTDVDYDPDPSFNRLEYCIICGSLRIQFGEIWRNWSSDITKKFLGQFTKTSNSVLKAPPTEFKIGPPHRSAKKLGRGLADLLKERQPLTTLTQLLEKGKPDAKNN